MRHAKQSLKTMPRQYSAVLHASACFVQEKGQCSLQQWQSRLDYYVYETVGQLRMTEMFDIVVDYPDSRPAVQDVKDCLAHTNLHRKFVAGFKQAIGERLLHAGHTSLTPSHHHTQALSNTRPLHASPAQGCFALLCQRRCAHCSLPACAVFGSLSRSG